MRQNLEGGELDGFVRTASGVQEYVWDSLGETPLQCRGQGQSGISLFDDAVRIGDRGVIGVVWIVSHVQPGGGGSPLGVPSVDVSNKALSEAMTLFGRPEFERLLLVEADECGKRRSRFKPIRFS